MDNYKNFINRISSTSSNLNLVKDISEYQQKIYKIQLKFEAFYNNDNNYTEVLNYRTALFGMIQLYRDILPNFINCLSNFDDKIFANFQNADDIIPISGDIDKINLSMQKVLGRKLITDKKNEFFKILDNCEIQISTLKLLLDFSSKQLIAFEKIKIDN